MIVTVTNPSPNTSIAHHSDALISGATDTAMKLLPLAIVVGLFMVAKDSIPSLEAFIAGSLQARTPSNAGPVVGTSEADVNTILGAIQGVQQSVSTNVSSAVQSVSGALGASGPLPTSTPLPASAGTFTDTSGAAQQWVATNMPAQVNWCVVDAFILAKGRLPGSSSELDSWARGLGHGNPPDYGVCVA